MTLDGPSERRGYAPGFDRRMRGAALLILAVIFGYLVVFLWHHESKDNGGHLGDFRTFYQAAQYALEGRDIYTAGHNAAQMYVYPPLIAFCYAPLTLLNELAAAHLSLLLNASMLLVAVWVAARAALLRFDAVRPGACSVAAAIVAVLSLNEIRAELTMLETDAIMLLAFALALRWLDRRPVFAGAALGFALNIKYQTIVALPHLLLRRRWVAAGGMGLAAVAFALLPAALLGWTEDLRCLRVSTGGLLRWVGVPPEPGHAVKVHNIADDLSVSVTSGLARVLGPRGLSNPLIMGAAAGLGMCVVLVVWRMYRANGLPFWRWPAASAQGVTPFRGLVAAEWAGLVMIALAFSPDTNTRHLVLTVIVNALFAAVLLVPQRRVSRLPSILGALLIFVGYIMPLGTKGSQVHWFYFHYSVPGWSLLVGYLLILWTALRVIARPPPDAPDRTPTVPPGGAPAVTQRPSIG